VRLGVLGWVTHPPGSTLHVVDGLVNGAGWSTRTIATISKWWDTWIIDGVGVNGPASWRASCRIRSACSSGTVPVVRAGHGRRFARFVFYLRGSSEL